MAMVSKGYGSVTIEKNLSHPFLRRSWYTVCRNIECENHLDYCCASGGKEQHFVIKIIREQ